MVYPPVVSLPGGGPPLGSLFGRESCEARTHKRSVVSKDFKVWIRLVMTMAIVKIEVRGFGPAGIGTLMSCDSHKSTLHGNDAVLADASHLRNGAWLCQISEETLRNGAWQPDPCFLNARD